MSIERLIRNQNLKFNDMIGVPCFTVFNEYESEKDLLCSSSIHEKEMWLQVIF